LRFVQSHRLTDVHLALGYGALSVAVACFLWDWKLGFDSTKYYSAVAVLVYMALNVALTFWSRNVEGAVKGATVYVGTSPSGETVCFLSSTSLACFRSLTA
jgi:signal peptidase complex subunit 2